MEKLRIVWTPEFAVGILDTIIKNNYNVVGVITAADKPAGRRGQK
jgi:methionyl-tRNA formyltransferase